MKQKVICQISVGKQYLEGGSKTMSLRKEHGGLELPALDALIAGKKLTWIIRIHFSEPQKWNMVG